MAINEKWSNKSWKRKQFTNVDTKDFEGEIVNACFSQDTPYTKVFPKGLTGVVFKDCNLDNCVIPPGNSLTGSTTNKHFATQDDGEFWLVDTNNNPISPLKPWRFDEMKLSKDPADIALAGTPESRAGMCITMWKQHVQDMALKELVADTDKLIQILKDEGKL